MIVAQFDGFEINPVHSGDAWKICDFCVANSDRLKRYFPETLEQNLNPALAQIFVDTKVKQFEKKSTFLFTLKHSESRELAGLIYIKELDWNKKQGEFAYCIDYRFENKGLISQSVKALSKYAYGNLDLVTLQIISHKTNIASVKVAENNGFKWIKTLKKEYTPPNEKPLNMELFELYNER